jgi:DNA repair exonuclease SbcCD nuclease subunit
VAREVVQLVNGGVGGYIYVGHLHEYDNHPKRHKDGYLNIGHMEEIEFMEVTTKVTKEYK